MQTLANIIWFLFGGLVGGLSWIAAGCIMYLTIIGIPVGNQCFKLAKLAFFPFGKEIVYEGGNVSLFINAIWIILCGWELALGYATLALSYFITIIGIPVGYQCLKLAQLSLMPFGAQVKESQ
ncbi:MAG: YccF domain-containing protein [bacterium]|nr:YccF domain-containing protein [bacterium]